MCNAGWLCAWNGEYITIDDVADQNFILQQSDYDRDTKLALDHYHVTNNFLRSRIDDQSIISMVESVRMAFAETALKKLTGMLTRTHLRNLITVRLR